jgi:hypothetical protein
MVGQSFYRHFIFLLKCNIRYIKGYGKNWINVFYRLALSIPLSSTIITKWILAPLLIPN